MFSAAFKNSLTERRHAVRVAAGVEQMEQVRAPLEADSSSKEV